MKTKRKRSRPEVGEEESSLWPGAVVVLVIIFIAAGAIAWGCHRQGMVWKSILPAVSCFVAGIAFVCIGLFELEWLERIVGFVDGIYSGLMQFFWTSWFGTLSESEFVGRQRARVYWAVFGVIAVIVGCLFALGIL
jgi:hypothetical protein